MARFAGSRAPSIGNLSRSGSVESITPMTFQNVTSNAGDSANAVSTGKIFGSIRDKSPKFDEIANTAETIRANEIITGMQAEAGMAKAGMNAAADIAVAEEQAAGMEAQGAAAKKGGMFSALGSIASAALPLALSDESTKHTIDELENACDVLRELRPVSFFYKEEYSSSPERMHYGFIAQEYQKVMPDQTYLDGSLGKLCIDTNELIALLVKANQELESRVRMLEVKNVLVSV